MRGFADELLAFNDIEAKINGISRIADIIWLHDEQYARELFTKALTFTDSKKESDKPRTLLRLRQDVIALIAKHDTKWAKRLIDVGLSKKDSEQPLSERRENNIEAATRLVKDKPDIAVEFASRSLQGGLSPSFVWFLKDLRKQSESAANQLFLDALSQLANQPSVDMSSFAMFGTYIFTSPRLDDSDPRAVMITRVGDIGMIDITADRPDIPQALVRAYLQTAVALLSRQITDS